MENKRGLSPVIATSLLVLLAVVLAIIIFVWARGVISEKVQKDLGGGTQNIERACESVVFQADVIRQNNGNIIVSLENTGNVPIHGVQIIKEDESSKRIVGNSTLSNQLAIRALQTSDLPEITPYSAVADGESVIVVPILIGTINSGTKQYICDKKFGIPLKVQTS